MFSRDLPDHFVERVKSLEVRLEAAHEKYQNLERQHQILAEETKRSRLFWHLIEWLPGGPRSVLMSFLFVVFLSSFTADLAMKISGFDKTMRRLILENVFGELEESKKINSTSSNSTSSNSTSSDLENHLE